MLIFVFGINYYQPVRSRAARELLSISLLVRTIFRFDLKSRVELRSSPLFVRISPGIFYSCRELRSTVTRSQKIGSQKIGRKINRNAGNKGEKLVESSDSSIHVGQRARLYPTRTLYPCASFRALINGTKIILKATESYRGLAAIRERRFNFSNFDSVHRNVSKRLEWRGKERKEKNEEKI